MTPGKLSAIGGKFPLVQGDLQIPHHQHNGSDQIYVEKRLDILWALLGWKKRVLEPPKILRGPLQEAASALRVTGAMQDY